MKMQIYVRVAGGKNYKIINKPLDMLKIIW